MHEGTPTAMPALELLEVNLHPDTPPEVAPPQQRRNRPWSVVALVAAVVVLAALGFAIARSDAPAGATPTPEPIVAAMVGPPAGIDGFAELYLSTYLVAAGPGRHDQIAAFYPGAPTTDASAPTRWVRHIATLGATDHGDGRWELHVAADVLVHDGTGYAPDGIHHYVVGILDTPHGFTATNLPLRIASPPPAPIAASAAGAVVEDPALAALIDGFLAAHLTGRGDVRSFIAADAPIVPVTPPAFVEVEIDAVVAQRGADGALHVHVVATGSNPLGDVEIELRLVVAASGGTYRIEQLTALPMVPAPGIETPRG